MTPRKLVVLATTFVALTSQPVAAKRVDPALPHVSAAIPVTTQSRPFLYAQNQIDAAGYIEEEYFISGMANAYDWAGAGHHVKIVAGPGKYVTRILVMRPRDAKRFSGNAEVTILNASLGVDFGGPTDFARMLREGDAWIGITSKPITANALKKFDPVRYAPLDWSNPAAQAVRCPQPSIIPTYMLGDKNIRDLMAKAGMLGSWPQSEDGLIWDMLGQLGQLLKSEQRYAILPGFSRPRLFLTGVSQSSILIRMFAGSFHDRFRVAGGKPAYDGYLAIVGPALPRINQCSEDVPLDDPRQKLSPLDVPFISLSSEGEMWQARATRQANDFTHRGGVVSYEVAGASHQARDIPGRTPDVVNFAPPADMAKAGFTGGAPIPMATGAIANDFIWQPLIRGAYDNLIHWSRRGIKPPQAPGIAIGADGEIVRDAYGNAIGGVRMPYIEAPLAAHRGYLTAGGMGGVRGTKLPFSPETLAALYPDHAVYVAKFNAATDRLLAGRWISAEDAVAMKAAAAAAPVPAKP